MSLCSNILSVPDLTHSFFETNPHLLHFSSTCFLTTNHPLFLESFPIVRLKMLPPTEKVTAILKSPTAEKVSTNFLKLNRLSS